MKKSLIIIPIAVIIILAVAYFYYPSQLLKTNLPSNNYEYETCDNNGACQMIQIDKIVQPSTQITNQCNPEGLCEDVPVNRLILKEGTDKKYCSNAPYLKTDYVDNWWNANGLIDECEMPPKADMQFAFKQHNQTLLSYTGTMQISLTILNYGDNYLALQVLTAEDNNRDNLPDAWVHCGNVDTIKGKTIKIVRCTGTNLKFVKLVNPEWNPSNLFLDRIEVLKAE